MQTSNNNDAADGKFVWHLKAFKLFICAKSGPIRMNHALRKLFVGEEDCELCLRISYST